MKKKIYILFGLYAFSFVLYIVFGNRVNHRLLTNGRYVISDNNTYISNYRQWNASTWAGCLNGQLYFCSGVTKPHNELCTIADGKIVSEFSLGQKNDFVRIVGSIGNYLYYWRVDYQTKQQNLFCLDISLKQEEQLFAGLKNQRMEHVYVDSSGTISFLQNAHSTGQSTYVHINGKNVVKTGALSDVYCIGTSKYTMVEDDLGLSRIYVEDENGNKQELLLDPAKERTLIPLDDGILIHNDGGETLLYWIDHNGLLREMFHVPCMSSESSVSICGSSVFISFLRYEGYGNFGAERYENDALEGTYRIDLDDYSVVKICDRIFDGMFNYDESGFICSGKDGNLYQMDQNGKVTPILK